MELPLSILDSRFRGNDEKNQGNDTEKRSSFGRLRFPQEYGEGSFPKSIILGNLSSYLSSSNAFIGKLFYLTFSLVVAFLVLPTESVTSNLISMVPLDSNL